MLDRHAKRFLDLLAAAKPQSALKLSIQERRNAMESLLKFARPEPVGSIENRTVPGPDGSLRVRIYSPAAAHADHAPGLIYFHGGGLVAGSLDTHDAVSRALANASACRLVAVDYRLAPEHRFPAAIVDGCAATLWVGAHAKELGIDPHCIAICGDSAGATLAAVVCRTISRSQDMRLAFQCLICPIMDFAADTESRRAFAHGHLVDKATLDHDLLHYLPGHTKPTDPRISPLRERDLRGLPPTSVHTAECDPLRDEGRAYADRLVLAGVKASYTCHPGMIHLFYGVSSVIPYARTAMNLIGAEIRAAMA